jgi:xylulokinase
MLDACEMSEAQMPGLYEGSDATGILRASVAEELGLPAGVVVAAGAGDNAAGAIGLGVLDPGQAFVSLGTSGVYFVANDGYAPNTKGGVHTFCHALPKRYHQMGVLLSAASALQWLSGLLGVSEAELLAELDASLQTSGFPADGPLFLPYLSGERTPHNDPNAQGVFFGLTHESGRPELTLAVLEGVAFAFADAQQSLLAAGSKLDQVAVIGGGARSPLWGRVLASALDRPLTYREGAELGAAFGAARLGRLALTGESPQDVCTPGAVREVIEPDPVLVDRAAARLPRFRDLYARLKDAWSPAR